MWLHRDSRLFRGIAMTAAVTSNEQDICGLCGGPGADKIPHPIHWPGEQEPQTELVHASCEADECMRAHAALSDRARESFLRWV